MGHVINASAERGVTLYEPAQPGRQPRTTVVNERVRVYWPADKGQSGLVDVRLLTGARAGEVWSAPRNELLADGSRFVATEAELRELANALRSEQFTDTAGKARPLPFEYPSEGCWARAQIMAEQIVRAGYHVLKVFLIDRSYLHPLGIFGTEPGKLAGPTEVKWWYHIAPIVLLRDGKNRYVIDPSLLDGPATPADWAAKMTTAKVETLTYAAMKMRLSQQPQWPRSPDQSPWLVIVDPFFLYPPEDPAEVPMDTKEQFTELRTLIPMVLQTATDLVPLRSAIAALNKLMHNWRIAVQAKPANRDIAEPYDLYQDDLRAAGGKFAALQPWHKDWLPTEYPNLLTEVWDTFGRSGVEENIRELLVLAGLKLEPR